MFQRSWVWLLAPFTGWTWHFFTLICYNNCNDVFLKRPKINEKRLGFVQFKNKFFKSCPKSSHKSFYLKRDVFKKSKKSWHIWTTFKGNFDTKNVQKSPNLVTLSAAASILLPQRVETGLNPGNPSQDYTTKTFQFFLFQRIFSERFFSVKKLKSYFIKFAKT